MEDRVASVFRIQWSFCNQHTGRTLIRNVSKFIQGTCAIQTAQHLLKNVRKYLPDFIASRILRWQFFYNKDVPLPLGVSNFPKIHHRFK